MRFRFLVVLFVVMQFASLSFAQSGEWVGTAALALFISVAVLSLLYGIGVAFTIDELKLMSTEELYQVIMTAVMIAVLFGAESFLNQFATALGLPVTPGIPENNLQSASRGVIDNTLARHATLFNGLKDFSVRVGEQSSKSLYCTWLGIGFNAAGCSSFRALTPIATLSMQALSVSIAELSSLRTLAAFAQTYSFTLLLPVGLLLRTFKLTRGAGGLFIGLAAGLYLFMPLAILFMNSLTARPNLDAQTATGASLQQALLNQIDCSPGDFVSGAVGSYSYENPDKVRRIFETLMGDLLNSQRAGTFSFVRTYLIAFLIEGTMMMIVALLVLLASVRWIARLAGADIDVFALARIA